MKRHALLKHLRQYGCELFREGANHSIYGTRRTRKHPLFLVIWKSPTNWHSRSARTWGFPSLNYGRMDVIAGTKTLTSTVVIPQFHLMMAANMLADTHWRAGILESAT